MANLSLARIMYGSNELRAASASMQPRAPRIQLPHFSPAGWGAASAWMNKLYSTLFPQRSDK
jgi:hypothetical protein